MSCNAYASPMPGMAQEGGTGFGILGASECDADGSSMPTSHKMDGFRAGVGLENVARRTLGIVMLLTTVFLWTTSNFLASFIFADNTYSKPFFITYTNASLFALSLPPILLKIGYQKGIHKTWRSDLNNWHLQRSADTAHEHSQTGSQSPLLQDESTIVGGCQRQESLAKGSYNEMLTVRETALISLEFSFLWFLANYFVAACLEYTSVASSTILTSTSSIFTLIFGALFRIEAFTAKKLVGVLASFIGIILISMVDISKDNDHNRGSFPHKSQRELALGDSLAFLSAIMYGAYAVVMKKRVGNENRVNMPLFFGFVGLFNISILWPGFIILQLCGMETFELPSTSKIWTVIMLNSVSSFISDYTWAYAMLLTTPLIVSVGLSLTIPLSLLGQIFLSSQYTSSLYWVGAVVVVLSFLFINHESHDIADDEVPA